MLDSYCMAYETLTLRTNSVVALPHLGPQGPTYAATYSGSTTYYAAKKSTKIIKNDEKTIFPYPQVS